MPSPPNQTKTKSIKKQFTIMLITALIMFGFGYALVPFFNVMCRSLGINGKVVAATQPTSNTSIVDPSRQVLVQFLTHDRADLDDAFIALKKKVTVTPGKQRRVAFYVENKTDKTRILQAIPSVSPGIAAKYLKKTECFCFIQQILKPHEGRDMPMIFHFDPELPSNIKTVTISYTIYDITDRVS